ncbi:MAG: glycine dehydrogenase, partial [Chloroflexi bacterium]|nr:glycine dehydrogenase [Chloroflexota bacterium]
MAFVPLTEAERRTMLEQVGVGSVAELFADIPEAARFPRLEVPPPLTELETVRKMSDLAARNRHLGELACFVGAGA